MMLAIPLIAWLIGWHQSSAVVLITALLAGALLMGIRERSLSHSFLSPFLDKKISVLLVASVRSDPVLGQPKVMAGYTRPATTTMLVTAISVEVNKTLYKTHLPLRFTTPQQIHFLPGTVISCRGILYSTSEKRVAGLFAERGAITFVHGAGEIGLISGAIRSDYRAVATRVGGDAGALMPGFVLGDTSLERHPFVLDMQRAGLTHLTAVSGENFVVIAAFMMWFLQWFISRIRIRLLINSLVLIGFIFLVHPSPSVMRATVMVAVVLLARARGQKASAMPALGLAIALLILLDPFQAIDPGFALSVGATAGILLFSKPVTTYLTRYLKSEKLASLAAISISANLICMPIAVAISGQFSLTSLISNILVETIVGPVTIVGFIAALFCPFLPSLSYIMLLTQKPLTAWVCLVAKVSAKVPVLSISKGFAGAGIICLVFLCGWITLRWRSWA